MGKLEEVQVGKGPCQATRVNKTLPTSLKQDLVSLLKSNVDLFTWITTDMPWIDLEFMSHQLSVFPKSSPMA